MKKIFNENFFTIIIIISMISLPLLQIIGLKFRSRFFYQEELLSGIGIFISLLLILYYVLNKKNNTKTKKNLVLSDIFIILSILFCIISFIFSKDLEKSLNGEYMYSETPLQVLAYFSLFFLCTLISKEENKKSIFEIFIFLAILESVIAFLQNFNLWSVPPLFDSYSHKINHLAFGLTEHCNFFAAISTVFTAICSSKFIFNDNKKTCVVFLILSIITCFSTLFTYTRLGIVGLLSIIIGTLFIILISIKKNKNKLKNFIIKFTILIICFIFCFLTIEFFYKTISIEFETSKKELSSTNIVNSDNSDININQLGTRRGLIWKVGLTSLRKYPFTGVGFDNYRYSFEIYPEKFGWSQNKGHNEYIHTFVTQGIFSGINYLAFAFYCCYFPFKKILNGDSEFSKSDLTKIFLIALFAYFVQALFNSSVTNVAPYKWILMGLLLPRSEQKNLFDINLFKNKQIKNG